MSKKSEKTLWERADEIPVEEWPESLRMETRIVRKQFKDMRASGHQFGAQFVGVRADGSREVWMAQDLMRDYRGKNTVAALIVQLVVEGCIEVMFAAEAWMGEDAEAIKWREENPDKTMEQYSKRVEVLYVTHYSVKGDVMASAKIENGNLGKFRVKRGSMSGRYANIFLRAQERTSRRN